MRDVLRAQAADQSWAQAQVRLRVAYSAFIRHFGPINHTVVSVQVDADTGEGTQDIIRDLLDQAQPAVHGAR